VARWSSSARLGHGGAERGEGRVGVRVGGGRGERVAWAFKWQRGEAVLALARDVGASVSACMRLAREGRLREDEGADRGAHGQRAGASTRAMAGWGGGKRRQAEPRGRGRERARG
jgi:hypothetical protein